jgi:hypothetical protein
MPSKTEVAALLKDAKARIEKHWIQGQMADGRGGVCSIGALQNSMNAANQVWYDSGEGLDLYEQAMSALAYQMYPANNDFYDSRGHNSGGRGHEVIHFNDHPTTTKDMVLDRFDDAIKCLEKAE